MLKHRARAVFLIIFAALVGYFVYSWSQPGGAHPFRLGLDLSGGTHLVYQADVSKIASGEVSGAMTSLRNVVERRVNSFGVGEPLVQTEEAQALSSKEAAYKLIVELPGVTDIDQAVAAIGATPRLEFRLASAADLAAFQASDLAKNATTSVAELPQFLAVFKDIGLTGSMVSRANLQFNTQSNQPVVGLTFNTDGRELFASTTKNNVGNYLGIFLDGQLLQFPTIRDAILDGQAIISGGFTVESANGLVRDLNYGALPIPIKLISTQTIGPSLGQAAVNGGVLAGIVSFIIIGIFLLIWYRLPGLIAVVALACYIAINLAVFQIGVSPALLVITIFFGILATVWNRGFLVGIPLCYILLMFVPGALQPVTLTAAGIAGFILSIGMAVDANILIFERMKEELASGKGIWDAMHQGFDRAWLSIRDSNTSSILTGIILAVFSSTAVIKGFALVFVIGVLISMFTAITASRLFLYAVAPRKEGKISRFLVSNGFRRLKKS